MPAHLAKAARLSIGPDCTIRTIASVHAEITRADLAGRSLQLDCSGVEQADVSLVQLVASLEATLATRKVGVVLDGASACVLAAFARAAVSLPAGAPSMADEVGAWQ